MRLEGYPMKDNGMFILKKSDFDDIAKMILTEYMPSVYSYPKAVDIEYLAQECLYLEIKHEYLSADGRVLGLIAFSDTQFSTRNLENEPTVIDLEEGTMLIDMSLIGSKNLARKRFTEAHESAHWICHRSYHSPRNQLYDFRQARGQALRSVKPMVVCRTQSIEQYKLQPSAGQSQEEYWEEWQADGLGAALLMPKETFCQAVEEAMRHYGYPGRCLIKGKEENKARDVIREVMQVFQVSSRAAQIRMNQFGLLRS